MTTVHLVGPAITVNGRYLRQRCSWCGEVLLDEDLALLHMAAAEASRALPTWQAGRWLEVDAEEGGPTICTLLEVEEDGIPVGACTRDVVPPVRLAGDG